MLDTLRHLLIGSPLPTRQLAETRLNKVRALAAFSPGALSSIAYANQEIYLALVVAGSVGLGMAWPVSLAITALLAAVALSYYQTIHGYPSGGGSYVAARENLGTLPGLIAASALLIDFLDETDRLHNDGQLAAVVLPELVPAKRWQALLHNQSARLLKTALLYKRRRLGFQRVIIDVPYHLRS